MRFVGGRIKSLKPAASAAEASCCDLIREDGKKKKSELTNKLLGDQKRQIWSGLW